MPAPALHAERRDRHAPGFRREDEIHAECAILPAAFHNVAGLNVEVQNIGQVLDLKLPDVSSLVDHDTFLLQCFVEWNEPAAVESIGSPQEENAEIFMGEGAGDGKRI